MPTLVDAGAVERAPDGTVTRDRTLLNTAELSSSGFRRAPVGQVLADLLTLPRGRLAQEAEQLIEVLERNDAAWKE
ncbi:MAG: hypothetical protein WA942_07910 [Mycolicibacter sinensis]